MHMRESTELLLLQIKSSSILNNDYIVLQCINDVENVKIKPFSLMNNV